MTLKTYLRLGRKVSRSVKVMAINSQGVDREESRNEHLHCTASSPSAHLAPAPLVAADSNSPAPHGGRPGPGVPVHVPTGGLSSLRVVTDNRSRSTSSQGEHSERVGAAQAPWATVGIAEDAVCRVGPQADSSAYRRQEVGPDGGGRLLGAPSPQARGVIQVEESRVVRRRSAGRTWRTALRLPRGAGPSRAAGPGTSAYRHSRQRTSTPRPTASTKTSPIVGPPSASSSSASPRQSVKKIRSPSSVAPRIWIRRVKYSAPCTCGTTRFPAVHGRSRSGRNQSLIPTGCQSDADM